VTVLSRRNFPIGWNSLGYVIIAGVGVLVFWPVFLPLAMDWYTYDIYSYGCLVPILSLYLIWQSQPALAKVASQPNFWGCVPLAVSAALYLLGVIASDQFLMRIALVLTILSAVFLMFGGRIFCALSFPLFYLFLMIPFPYALAKTISHNMMLFDAKHAATVLQGLGYPVYLDGNFLHLPFITLEVAEVCSGIASMFALFVLGVFWSYFLPMARGYKVLLAVFTVPFAIIVNLFRIVLTVLLTFWFGPAVLKSDFHMWTGTFNFVLAVFLFLYLGELLRKRVGRAPVRQAVAEEPSALAMPAGQFHWQAAVVMVAILGGTAYAARVMEQRLETPLKMALESLPDSLAGYSKITDTRPDKELYRDPNAEQSLSRLYTDQSGNRIAIYVGFRADHDGNRLYSPKLILPSGASYLFVEPASVSLNQAAVIHGNWMVEQQGTQRILVFYWYQSGGAAFGGELTYRWTVVKRRILDGRSDMAVVRIATPLSQGLEGLDNAKERLGNFLSAAYVPLNQILPGPAQ
jgi:EpsI family protein